MTQQLASLVERRLWLKVLIGIFTGLATGLVFGPTVGLIEPGLGTLVRSWLALPGQSFLAATQMIVIPLAFASISLGLASSETAQELKQLGIAVTAHFIITTAIRLWIASVMQPGLG